MIASASVTAACTVSYIATLLCAYKQIYSKDGPVAFIFMCFIGGAIGFAAMGATIMELLAVFLPLTITLAFSFLCVAKLFL